MKNLTNLSKKLLATLLAVLLFVSLLPVGALAEEGDVAQVGDNTYATLQEAVTAVYYSETKEGTVKLLTHTSIPDTDNGLRIWQDCSVILDLNGKTLHGPIWNYSTLTITGNGTVNSAEGSFALVGIGSESNVTIKNGTFQGVGNNGGTMLIEGGNFTAQSPVVNEVTLNREGLHNWAGSVVVRGGCFISPVDCSASPVYNEDIMTIESGEVRSLGTGVPSIGNQDPVDSETGNPTGAASQLKISGGVFVGRIESWQYTKPKITGGTFDTDVTQYVPNHDIYTVEKNEENGTWTVGLDEEKAVAQVGTQYYTTLQEAINACTEGNETVTLLTDVTESVTVAEGQNITLDLNGKTLKNAAEAQNSSVANRKHTITNNGILTITGEGNVDNVSHGTAALFNKGTANVSGGTFTRSAEAGTIGADGNRTNGGNSWYVVRNELGGTIHINGGKIEANGQYSAMISNNGTMTVSGGELNSANYTAIQNQPDCQLTINGGKIKGGTTSPCLSLYGTTNIEDGADVEGWVQVWSYDFYNKSSEPVHLKSVLNINGGTLKDTQLQCVNGLSGFDPTIKPGSMNTKYQYAVWGTGDTTSTININGGNLDFSGGIITCRIINNDSGIGRGIEKVPNGAVSSIWVKGGTFKTAVPEEYCADNFVPKTNSDGTYGVTEKVPVTGVTLNQTTASLYSNTTPNTVTLTATVAPENTTDDTTVTWISSNENVAKVDANGVVTSTGNGTATITATVGNVSATCNVTVSTYTYVPSYGGGGGGTVIVDPDVPLDPRPWLFTDVPEDAWYYDAVHSVFMSFYMNGESDTIFNPTGKTTRAMMAQIVCNLDESFIELPSDFTDVAEGAWYAGAVGYAASIEVVTGYGGTTLFGPDDPVTREQIALMLYRLANAMEFDTTGRADLSGYTDSASVSTWAQEAMQWAVSAGVITGSNNELRPQADAMRCEIAQMIDNFTAEYFPAEEE